MLQTMKINADGTVESIQPAKGKHFSLAEMQGGVEGYIEVHRLPSHKAWMVINEEGKLLGLEVNRQATEIWWNDLKKQGLKTGDVIVGNVLVVQQDQID